MDHVARARHRRPRLLAVAQIRRLDLRALADPRRRLALVADADLELGVAQQRAHDRTADHAGAAGDENAAHRGSPAAAKSSPA
jgi:hypothetical protein